MGSAGAIIGAFSLAFDGVRVGRLKAFCRLIGAVMKMPAVDITTTGLICEDWVLIG